MREGGCVTSDTVAQVPDGGMRVQVFHRCIYIFLPQKRSLLPRCSCGHVRCAKQPVPSLIPEGGFQLGLYFLPR